MINFDADIFDVRIFLWKLNIKKVLCSILELCKIYFCFEIEAL